MNELKIGEEAPNFLLPDQDGKINNLNNFKGKWLVLYFYPKDDTPGCTVEAITFTKYLNDFKKLNAEIVGISPDNEDSHCKFIDKHKLEVKLLCDPDHKITEQYNVWGEKSFMGRKSIGVIRSTFLINPKGRIAYSWRNVKVDGHVDVVLKKLKDLQT